MGNHTLGLGTGNRCNILKGLALGLTEHGAQQTGALIMSQIQHGPLACLESATDIINQELPNRTNIMNALRTMPEKQCKLMKYIQP